jgi:hypothetical protein
MGFYQVNQRRTFAREFKAGYLCSPSGNRAGWQLMTDLRSGDILFNYNSTCGAVLGISRVTNIGQHKGTASQTARVISGTQCIQYFGRHLSEDDFSPKDREHYRQNYPSYFEVHTVPLRRANLGKLLLPRTPIAYLVPISNAVAGRFLQQWDIRLEDLR